MALPARPDVVNINGQRTYHSLDATDQVFYDNLNDGTKRRKFVEMVHRWREGGGMSLLSPNVELLMYCSYTGSEQWQ
jgi:hypothetical protein